MAAHSYDQTAVNSFHRTSGSDGQLNLWRETVADREGVAGKPLALGRHRFQALITVRGNDLLPAFVRYPVFGKLRQVPECFYGFGKWGRAGEIAAQRARFKHRHD